MATPTTPALHDAVRWRGAKWLVTRVLRFGRLEISAIADPRIQWTCLAGQLTWDEQARAWICTAYLVPTRGGLSCGD